MLQENTLPRYDASNHPLDLAPRNLGRFNCSLANSHTGKPRTLWPFSVSKAMLHPESALSLDLRSAKTGDHPAITEDMKNSGSHPTAASFVS